jgi:hypothetical protein
MFLAFCFWPNILLSFCFRPNILLAFCLWPNILLTCYFYRKTPFPCYNIFTHASSCRIVYFPYLFFLTITMVTTVL